MYCPPVSGSMPREMSNIRFVVRNAGFSESWFGSTLLSQKVRFTPPLLIGEYGWGESVAQKMWVTQIPQSLCWPQTWILISSTELKVSQSDCISCVFETDECRKAVSLWPPKTRLIKWEGLIHRFAFLIQGACLREVQKFNRFIFLLPESRATFFSGEVSKHSNPKERA